MPWLDPVVSLRWGPYTRLDGDEQQAVVTLTRTAKDAGLITTRMAVEKLADAGVFDIDNVDATLEALATERVEREQRAMAAADEQAARDAATLHAAAGKTTDGQRQRGTGGQPGGPAPTQQD